MINLRKLFGLRKAERKQYEDRIAKMQASFALISEYARFWTEPERTVTGGLLRRLEVIDKMCKLNLSNIKL